MLKWIPITIIVAGITTLMSKLLFNSQRSKESYLVQSNINIGDILDDDTIEELINTRDCINSDDEIVFESHNTKMRTLDNYKGNIQIGEESKINLFKLKEESGNVVEDTNMIMIDPNEPKKDKLFYSLFTTYAKIANQN